MKTLLFMILELLSLSSFPNRNSLCTISEDIKLLLNSNKYPVPFSSLFNFDILSFIILFGRDPSLLPWTPAPGTPLLHSYRFLGFRRPFS